MRVRDGLPQGLLLRKLRDSAAIQLSLGGFFGHPWCQARCVRVDLEVPSPQSSGWCGLTGPLRGRQWPGLLHSFWVSCSASLPLGLVLVRTLLLLQVTLSSLGAQRCKSPGPCGFMGFPDSSVGKESACSAEDLDSIPEIGRASCRERV